MLFKHMREELQDAARQGWRAEARLVARNTIIAAAAAFCPLGIIIAVIALALWDNLTGMPDLMLNTAYYYPLTGILCIALAIWMFNRTLYTGAMLVAMAPFLWIFVFIGAGLYWIFV
ncbi:MAG: hypothetical protein RIM33_02225 [Alphaproteobacteria bacterium]